MTISWTVDHEQQTIVAVCDGDVTRREMEDYLEAAVAAGTAPYRKLFDGAHATTSMTDEDMVALGAVVRGYHARGPVGALAIVLHADHTQGLARLFGALAAADRPLRIFQDPRAARRWLDAQGR
ncbi:MAG: hypothetical protein ACOY4R_19285 [Pseudomonadota bacterium]